jgi:hypothetical protein
MNGVTPSPRQGAEPPLWSIAAAAAVILLTPMLLFSLAPDGPIRDGDTVFSTGAHKVPLFKPDQHRQAGYDSTCLLDPKDPMIVIHAPIEGLGEEEIIAQVQGKNTIEWPFCPPQAELLIKPHQVTQQPGLIKDLRDGMMRLFKSS